MMDKVDYLIIGQGLAGSILALELLDRGKSVRIIDNNHQGAASFVAAGIINPITGRRFAKSWRIDEFLPFAKAYYQNLENRFDIKIFHDRSVLRFLKGNKDINDWYGRSAWEGFSEYMHELKDLESLAEYFHLPFGVGEIRPAAQVDLSVFVKSLRAFFESQKILTLQKINVQQSKQDLLKDLKTFNARQFIFCEGQQARFNPFFQSVLFEPAKGEVLIVKVPGMPIDQLIKAKLMMAPLGNDLFWAGSNYEWNAPHDQPTESFKRDYVDRLEKTLKRPFEIVDHITATRPTVKDRRPVLGIHPNHPEVIIFNGLGTKGASLAPFWAKELTNHLLHQNELPNEVQFSRFL